MLTFRRRISLTPFLALYLLLLFLLLFFLILVVVAIRDPALFDNLLHAAIILSPIVLRGGTDRERGRGTEDE